MGNNEETEEKDGDSVKEAQGEESASQLQGHEEEEHER